MLNMDLNADSVSSIDNPYDKSSNPICKTSSEESIIDESYDKSPSTICKTSSEDSSAQQKEASEIIKGIQFSISLILGYGLFYLIKKWYAI
ncbi:hypothetical protein GUI12_00490 [Anaplasmataceae bacterium AB001_6]|nr:hypothetical protein GUI12_00490 [Anaplasmataceae bacterium AB001_6]